MRSFQSLAILAALFMSPGFAAAQTPPTPPAPPPKSPPAAKPEVRAPGKEYVTSAKPIDAEGLKQISEFVDSRANLILTGDPNQVRQATSDLLTVLRQAIATPVFRRACADALKPFVLKTIAGGDAFRINNILQVIQWTRTPEALDILIQQATPSSQKDAEIRIAASRLLPGCVATANMTAPQIDSASRRVREAAEAETDWIVCAHELQALATMVAVSQDAKLAPQADLSRGEFLKVLHAAAVKASKPDSADQIFALQRGLIILRDMLLKTSKDRIDKKMHDDILEITGIAVEISKQPLDKSKPANESFNQSAAGSAIVAGVIDKLVGSPDG